MKDELADPTGELAFDVLEDRILANQCMDVARRTAPRLVVEGLELIHRHCMSVPEAADYFNVHRTTLRRAINRSASDQQFVAAT
jgi:hypothetical protein